MLAKTFVFASVVALAGSGSLSGCMADQPSADESEVGEARAELLALSSRVSSSVHNICINGTAFTGAFSTALNNAIASYDALALSFRFTRTTGSTTGCNAVINARILTGFEVGAGFPSGGLPFNSLEVGSGFSMFNGNVITHVITHLLGHDIGLIHSDVGPAVPVSCGPDQAIIPNFGVGSHAGGSGVGVVLIPGAPPPAPGGSIMNTCIPAATNGRLTSSDISGLNFYF
jgi:hypothetical protein